MYVMCTCIHPVTCMFVCVYTCYIYTCICTCKNMCVCTYTTTHTHTHSVSLSLTHSQGGFAAMASFPHALPPDIDDFNTLSLRVKADGFFVCARATHAYTYIRAIFVIYSRAHTHTCVSTLTLARARVHTCACGGRD
jgi:Na+/melibiose symporter-like transporter